MNNISNEYKIFESQPEIKRVKSITTNDELNKLVGKKSLSKKIVAMIVAGTLFASGAMFGANLDNIKDFAGEITSTNTETVIENDNQIIYELCERTGKTGDEIYNDYQLYRNKLFEITGISEAPTQENYIRFIKNYDSYMNDIGLAETNKVKGAM